MPSSGSTIHTRSALQPDRIVGALLGEHRVVGPLGRQGLHQEVVGSLVPRRLPLGPACVGKFLADRQQQLAGLRCQLRGQCMI